MRAPPRVGHRNVAGDEHRLVGQIKTLEDLAKGGSERKPIDVSEIDEYDSLGKAGFLMMAHSNTKWDNSSRMSQLGTGTGLQQVQVDVRVEDDRQGARPTSCKRSSTTQIDVRVGDPVRGPRRISDRLQTLPRVASPHSHTSQVDVSTVSSTST